MCRFHLTFDLFDHLRGLDMPDIGQSGAHLWCAGVWPSQTPIGENLNTGQKNGAANLLATYRSHETNVGLLDQRILVLNLLNGPEHQ